MPPPFPEKFLDVRHVRTAGDVLDRLVINRNDQLRVGDRCTIQVGHDQFRSRFFAGLVLFRTRFHIDVQYPLFRRNGDFPRFRNHFTAGHEQGFDEKVRHVLLRDGNFDRLRLARHFQNLRRQAHAVRRFHEQQHEGILAVGIQFRIYAQAHIFAGRVFRFFRDQFQGVEFPRDIVLFCINCIQIMCNGLNSLQSGFPPARE